MSKCYNTRWSRNCFIESGMEVISVAASPLSLLSRLLWSGLLVSGVIVTTGDVSFCVNRYKKFFFFLLSWKCDFLVVGNEGDRQLDQKPAWRILADSSRRSCTHYWSSVNSPMCWSDRYPRLHDHLSVIASLLVGDSLVQWSLRSLILLRWWSSKDSYFLWHIGLSSYQEDSDPRLCQKDEAVCLKI